MWSKAFSMCNYFAVRISEAAMGGVCMKENESIKVKRVA
jgi:hypothetical protein